MDLRFTVRFWPWWFCSPLLFRALLSVILLGALPACTFTDKAPAPPPTPGLPRQVRLAPDMRGLIPALESCAVENGLSLLVEENPHPFSTPLAEVNLGWAILPPEGMSLYQIGQEDLVVIVNSDNPINSLDIQMLQKMVDGEISNWDDLPESETAGRTGEINIWLPADYETGFQLLMQTFPTLNRNSTGQFKVAPGITAMTDAVAQDQNALGFIPSRVLNPKIKMVSTGSRLLSLQAPVLAAFNPESDPGLLSLLGCLQKRLDQQIQP